MYNPVLNLEHLTGDNYQLTTTVEVKQSETLELESNNVIGTERHIVYRVVGDDFGDPTDKDFEISFEKGDTTKVKTTVKKGGEVKGENAVMFD